MPVITDTEIVEFIRGHDSMSTHQLADAMMFPDENQLKRKLKLLEKHGRLTSVKQPFRGKFRYLYSVPSPGT